MGRANFVLLCACLIVVVFATTAVAEPKGSFQIVPFGGSLYLDEGVDMRTFNPYGGLRVGYWISERSGLEVSLGYTRTRLDTVDNFYEGEFLDFAPEFNVYVTTLNYNYNILNRHDITPFVFAGPGFTTMLYRTRAENQDILVNYGVGLKYFFKGRFAVRGELTHYYVLDEGFENNMSHFSATVGLSVGFGGDTAKWVKMAEPIKAVKEKEVLEAPPELEREAPYGAVGLGMEFPDADQDGVPDNVDKCPDTPFEFRQLVDETGCYKAVTIQLLANMVYFDSGSAVVKDEYKAFLNRVANELNNNPEKGLMITGHTDNLGTETDNVILSQKRAAGIEDYLVSQGIDSSRIASLGMGGALPLASNDTAQGRAQNRRGQIYLMSRPAMVKNMGTMVFYDFARTDLKSGYEANLQQVVSEMNARPGSWVLITGNCDAVGSDSVNIPLSLERAKTVKSYLLNQGVDVNKVSLDCPGEANPVADNSTAAGRAKNRRVDVDLYY
jgi:OOP family OmpA-OmpF porin